MSINLLAVDTATEACSVALQVGASVFTQRANAPRQHTKQLLPIIDHLIKESGQELSALDSFVLSVGPGSFTGLRIGAGIIQGLAFALDKPVIPISTLQALAQGVYEQYGHTAQLVALDARMGEVYWGIYRLNLSTGVMVAEQPDRVSPPQEVRVDAPDGDCVGAGPAWAVYGHELKAATGVISAIVGGDVHAKGLLPAARICWQMGQTLAASAVIPAYCRNKVANKSPSTP